MNSVAVAGPILDRAWSLWEMGLGNLSHPTLADCRWSRKRMSQGSHIETADVCRKFPQNLVTHDILSCFHFVIYHVWLEANVVMEGNSDPKWMAWIPFHHPDQILLVTWGQWVCWKPSYAKCCKNPAVSGRSNGPVKLVGVIWCNYPGDSRCVFL